MVDSYYGGNLSQDRIAYHVYREVLNYASPEDDLGDPALGVVDVNVVNVLQWALNGASVVRFSGKPDFSQIEDWIDSNRPIIRDGGGTRHLMTVIDGYDTDGQMVYVIDPLTGNESKVPYDSLDVYIVCVATGDHITAVSDEPTIWMDSDGDGVVDFDEINRFHTDPYNNDTYGLGINDKTVIKYMYMDHLTFPTATFKCSPETPLINEQTTFDASGSNGNITLYKWKFGDSNITTVTEPTISHAYNQPGTYNVTLTVNDANGLWNTTSSSVTVIQNQNVSGTTGAFYRQSLDRTGYASTEGPETPDLLWTSYVNDSVTTSPLVADGKVFVGTSGGKLYALDMTTGHIIWIFDCGSPISSSPAFQDGVVFFGTENVGKIYAIDASSGLARWLYQVPAGAAVYSSPAVVDGKVIVGSSDGDLFCLNQAEGQVLWATQLGGGYLSSPAIQNGTVYVTSALGVHAVDMLTGASIWEHATTWPVKSCPAVADGLVFVGAEDDDRVYALDQSTGKLVWSLWTGGWLTPPAVDSSKQLAIIGSKDFKLYCVEEHTGYLKWAYVNGPNYLSAPTISANGLVYIGTSDGSLRSVNETTGEEVWKYNVTTSIVSSPTLASEHVLVGTLEGKIFCFGPIFPANIIVSNLTVSKSTVGQGYSSQINATADCHGDSEETFNMTIYANGTAIETKEATLMNGSSTITTFAWNTTGFAYGNYTISAYVWPVPYETTDNYTQTVHVGVAGDVSSATSGVYDGKVDMRDISYLVLRFNSKPGSTSWNPNVDVNDDGVVNMRDISIAILNFNKHE
jgi:outer membrane protein assembly factor BamB